MSGAPQSGPQRVGRFRVIERLAVGGMAEVLLGVEGLDTARERLVVIKRMLPHLAQDTYYVDMFVREAGIAKAIDHVNVVEIHELGSDGGFPYIAMEYVPGVSFRQLLDAAFEQGEQLPVGVAIDLLRQACEGAHAAHSFVDDQGRAAEIVHRDLSPHNLLVTPMGAVKVVDFGIAKATENMDHTRTGILKGKVGYLSPEQCMQTKVDRRSDIFTLGIVSWELFAGRRLFEGSSDLQIMQDIVAGRFAELSQARPDLPLELAQAVHRCLALAPDDRFQTAEALSQALGSAAERADVSVDRQTTAGLIQRLSGEVIDAKQSQFERSLTLTAPLVAPPVRLRRRTTVAVAVLAVGAAALATAGAVRLRGEAVGPPLTGEPIVILWAPTIDVPQLRKELEPLRTYLEATLRRPFEFPIGESYTHTAEALAAGQVPYASLPPYIYIQTHASEPQVEVLLVKLYAGTKGSDGLLLVNADIEVDTAADLAGRVFCYTDRSSTTGYVLPRAWLRRQGVDPDTAFSTTHDSGNHMQLIRDVSEGRCDAGGTYTGAWQTAAEAGVPVSAVRQLAVTGRSPHDALSVGPGAEAGVTDALREALLAFKPRKHVGTKVVGTVERISGFADLGDAHYDKLREALSLSSPPE